MFSICDKVVYLNTATRQFDTAVIKGIQIVPTGISKSEAGEGLHRTTDALKDCRGSQGGMEADHRGDIALVVSAVRRYLSSFSY